MKNIEKDTTLKKIFIYLLTKPVVLVLSREPKILDFLFTVKGQKISEAILLGSQKTYAIAPKMGQVKISIYFFSTKLFHNV